MTSIMMNLHGLDIRGRCLAVRALELGVVPPCVDPTVVYEDVVHWRGCFPAEIGRQMLLHCSSRKNRERWRVGRRFLDVMVAMESQQAPPVRHSLSFHIEISGERGCLQRVI